MIKFKKVRVYQEQIDNAQVKRVSLFTNDETSRVYRGVRANLDSNECLIQEILTFFNSCFNNSKVKANIIKKTVRIDDELSRALYSEAHFNSDSGEISFNKLVKGSISEKINTPMLYGNKLDLIPTHKFAHRITIHFSLHEHIYLQTIVYELKQKGLDWVNFSVVVRSILYEALGLITEYRISHRSPKQLLSVA